MFWIGLFTIGTLPFFGLLGFLWVYLTACVAYEKPGLATVALVAAFAGYNYSHGIALHTYFDNPLLLVEFVGGYLLCGLIWAFIQWALFVKDRSDAYDEAKTDFLQARKVSGTRIPDELLKQWQDYVGGHYFKSLSKPIAREHKSRILTWMYLWMQSLVWWLIGNFAKKAFQTVLRFTQTLFQQISDAIWKSRDDDFREAPKDPEVEADLNWQEKRAQRARGNYRDNYDR